MSESLLDRARWVVLAARKRGAGAVRAVVSRSRDCSLEWRDGQVDQLGESTRLGLSVTLFVDGRYSVNSTNDLRPAALERFLAENLAMTRLLSPDEYRKLPDPARYAGRYDGDLGVYDPAGAAQVDGVSRRKLARAMEEAARSAGGSVKINSVSATVEDSVAEHAMVNSNGMEGVRQSTSFVLFAMTSLLDGGGRRPEGAWHEVSCRRDVLPDAGLVGARATGRAMECLGQGPIASGLHRCVVENRQVGRLLGGLFQALSGRAIQQRQSFLADKLGQRVLGGKLTMLDDPHLLGGLASRGYDDEGMSTVKRTVVESGVLRSFFLDTYYAGKLGMPATSGGSTNLVFETGTRDMDSLLREMGDGILVTGFIGGNANAATGDFSYGIRGHWVEGGRRVKPVSEMNLSGNHLSFWDRLVETGNDPFVGSSIRSPSMRLDAVQFSGA